MNLRHLVQILGLLFFASEIALSLSRRAKSQATAKDSGSLWILWIALVAGVQFGVFATDHWPQTRLHPLAAWQIAGCSLMVLGGALRWWSILYLGKFFTVNVAVHGEHRVVDTGPYRYIRHPSYAGALVAFIGLGLGLASWISIFAIMLTSVAAYAWRIHVEESVLAGALGDNYLQYMQRTKRLLPGIY